jgi:maltose alpha-D-glucosyltransferase / alpha-amylase
MNVQVSNLNDLLAEARPLLEQQALPAFLHRQRWFGGKARKIKGVAIGDWTRLTPPRQAGANPEMLPAIYFALIEVQYDDSGAEWYFLPLTLDAKRNTVPAEHPAVLAEVRAPGGEFVLVDAVMHDATCELLLLAFEKSLEWPTSMGRLRALPTPEFALLRGPTGSPLPIARGAVEQSNTNIRFGDRLLLKLFRRCESGPNPDFEIIRFLTDKTGFRHIPRLAGGCLFQPHGGSEATFAMLQDWVANDGNAWEQALQYVRRYFDHARLPDDLEEYAPLAELLGRRTAEMHQALASAADDSAFQPEPLTLHGLQRLIAQTHERAAEVLRHLEKRLPDLPAGARRQAVDLAAVQSNLQTFLTIPALDSLPTKIRCHGDYHLGQILWAAGDYVILDFEGEPARSLAERRDKYSPLKDVAGMVRSFHYAAYAALFLLPHEQQERLEARADAWHRRAAEVFVDAYRRTAVGASFLPADVREFHALLNLFVLEKAVYELSYELNNRPNWTIIPLHGLLTLLHPQSEISSTRPIH